jgi:hypothetical protein
VGRIGRLVDLSVDEFVELIAETIAGNNETSDFFTPPGDDSVPLPEDRIVLVEVNGTNNAAAVGVLSVSQGAKPGEKILYARDKDCNVVSVFKMLNDGSVAAVSEGDISFDTKKNFSLKIEKDFNVEAKGDATVKAGNITIDGDLKVTGNVIMDDKLTVTGDIEGKAGMKNPNWEAQG